MFTVSIVSLVMLSGRPLLDTRADAPLFVDRDDVLADLRRAIAAELNVILLGARGAGKSSLLRRVAYELRELRAHRIEFVDAGPAGDDAGALLSLIADRLVGPDTVIMRATSRLTAGGDPHVPLDLVATVDRLRGELPRQMAAVPGDADGPAWDPGLPVVVIVDGAPPSPAHTLFGKLRDELWTLPVVWVVSGDEKQRGNYLRPPADAFFDVQLTLQPLAPAAAVDLLRRRLDKDDRLTSDELRQIVASTDRTPRAVLQAARRHLLDPSSTGHEARGRREAALRELAELGRPAHMLVAELQARGGAASASDDGLQSALGWTRPRLVQLFKELEKRNLVVATHQRSESGGRPRTVYELVEDVL